MLNWFELCKLPFDKLTSIRICNCPICDKQMKFPPARPKHISQDRYEIDCYSNCFNMYFWRRRKHYNQSNTIEDQSYVEIHIFDHFAYNNIKDSELSFEESIAPVVEKIAYWKKDYRYVAELLERS